MFGFKILRHSDQVSQEDHDEQIKAKSWISLRQVHTGTNKSICLACALTSEHHPELQAYGSPCCGAHTP